MAARLSFTLSGGAHPPCAPRLGSLGRAPTPTALLQTSFGQPPMLMATLLSTLPASPAGVRYGHLWEHDVLVASSGRASLAEYCVLGARDAVLTLRDPGHFPAPDASDART